MRVLVCGGRDFNDERRLFEVLDSLQCLLPKGEDLMVIEGGAKGADSLAVQWAHSRGFAVKEFPAQWGRYGRKAGPIRNQQMIDEGKPTFFVAFPGGKGTADMVERARRAKIPGYIMKDKSNEAL